MPFRKKDQERLEGNFQRLRREIREELGRIRAGVPLEQGAEPERERNVVSALDEMPVPAAVFHEPERSHVPLWQRLERLETMRRASASSFIQRAALGQIKGAPDEAALANGAPRPVEDGAPSYAVVRQTTLRLEAVAVRLEELIGRLVELTIWLSRVACDEAPQPAAQPPAEEQSVVAETRFEPRNGTVQLTVTDVPSLQSLMRVDRALSDLAAVADASIAGFEDGSATMHVTLLESMSLNDLMQGLRDAMTLQLLVEESCPEASRLRLRFVPDAKSQADFVLMPDPTA